jgi:hypothetical protein
MNDRVYDRFANALMLVAVLSALVFDAGVLPHIVVGTIGGVAALASAYLYFSNQQERKTTMADQSCSKMETAPREKPAKAMMTAGTSFAAPQVARDAAGRWVVTLAKREKHVQPTYIFHHYRHLNLKVSEGVFYGGALIHQEIAESNAVISPNDVAACAIEIIQHLSKQDGDDRWEFHFGPNGLRVSAKKGHASPERISSQGDLDFFSEMPTTSIH